MARSPALAPQFEELSQQHLADQFGMWVFLVTELMFFGALFTCYSVYRYLMPDVFAQGSHHLGIVLGGVNTGVLLCSSLTMALAVRNIQIGQSRAAMRLIFLTCALGLVFLGIKGVEYHEKVVEHLVPGSSFRYDGADPMRAQIFFWLYFAMTGLHGLHVLAGVAVLFVVGVLIRKGRVNQERYIAVEVTGLYWHFVDIVWVFLYPLLYLAGAHA